MRASDMSDAWAAIKTVTLAVLLYLIQTGQIVEPNGAPWIMAFAGALLGAAYIEDKSIWKILVHTALGTVIGIGIQLAADIVHLPPPLVALFAGLFGARFVEAFNRRIDVEDIMLFVPPWLKGERK